MILYGRDAELAAIDDALANARAGRGRAVFVTGEAGMGKSALLAEARARANRPVLDGAAWESPGAPPYWPWIQVLRAAEARFGERVRGRAGIVALLGDAGGSVESIEPAAARFALLDAVVRTLVTLAADEPLVVVLDDLHAADLPSIELLDLAVREVPRSAIAIVGGWRDAELAGRPDAAKRLSRLGRHAITIPLRRLSEAEVTSWIGSGGADVHAASEGNPLFVEELLRSRATGMRPRGITNVLDDHLALISADARGVLAAASVLGRELAPSVVADVSGRDLDLVEAALREATAVGLGDVAAERWRFTHVLVRDHLYESLPARERIALHRRAGEVLARVAPATADAAHHLIAGITDGDVTRAVAVAREAATAAYKVHAFEDAAALLAAALRALEAHTPADAATRIDVGLELAHARQASGAIEPMQSHALRAADLARTEGDAERFAYAALAYAGELASGRRDPAMIELLETATAMLPPIDGPLQARVMARLAAALVPPPDPTDERPYVLADAALAMADRLGDLEAKMFALRYSAHAHGFRQGIAEALPGVRDVIALSDRLGRPLEALEHRTYVVNSHLVMGDLAAADAATEPLAALLGRLSQPHYQWRLPTIRASRAIIRGDFVEADRLIAISRRLAKEHELDRARMACSFSELSVALCSQSAPRACTALPGVRAIAAMVGGPISLGILGAALAMAGEHDEARRVLAQLTFVPPFGLSLFGLEAALLVDDRTRIAMHIQPLVDTCRRAPMAYGPALSLILCPIAIVLGEALVRLDRTSEAVAPLENGLALARKLESPPFIARGAVALAALLPAHERDRAHALRAEAKRLAGPAEDRRTIDPTPAALAITRDGDAVRIRWRACDLRMSPSKGLDYLAALVARPSGEIHVSELVSDEDRGDAGEMIDASARAAYKARIEELREDLAEAEGRNDLGRIDRLTAELEMITEQVVASTGLGGRSRRSGSRVERARVNVQRRIRDAIQRVAAEDSALGRHLDATIRTGTFCSFTPLDD